MAEKFSIEISAKDNYTQALTTVRNANRRFGDDLTGLSRKLDALNEAKYTLKVDTDKAYAALEKAQKKFDATGKAADRASVEMAMKDYGTAKRNLDLLSEGADQTEKTMMSMTGAIEKADNRASKSTFGKLAQSGLGQMAIDTATNAIGTFASSAYGSKTGNMVSSVVSGAASGALMGSAVGPIGTAIGAVVGGISGAVNAKMQDYKDQDEAFKAVVKDRYNNTLEEENNSLTSGITYASEREGDLRAFTTLLNGDRDKAVKFQNTLIEIGRTPPFSYSTVAKLSKELLGLGNTTDETTKKINDLVEAAAAEDWSEGTVESINEVLNQVLISGEISSGVLETLDRNGLDAEKAISEAFHISEANVADKISELDATSVVNAIYNYMGNNSKFKGASKALASTYEGAKGIADSYEEDQKAAMGKGYTAVRESGLAEHNKIMGGDTGKSLEQANEMLGQFQADLENTKEELVDNAKVSITSGIVTGIYSDDDKQNAQIQSQLRELANDYQKQILRANIGDLKAKQKAERDVQEAVIVAENAYKLSDGYQLEIQGDRDLAEAIGEDAVLHDDYWNAGYIMGQWFSRGRQYYINKNSENDLKPGNFLTNSVLGVGEKGWDPLSKPPALQSMLDKTAPWIKKGKANTEPELSITTQGLSDIENIKKIWTQDPAVSMKEVGQDVQAWERSIGIAIPGKATGINRVPYNNYPALLHEDEQVLTGVEARSQKRGGGVQVTVTGPVTVRRESDIDAIASQLFDKIQRAAAVTP